MSGFLMFLGFLALAVSIYFGVGWMNRRKHDEMLSNPPTPFIIHNQCPPPPACTKMRKDCIMNGMEPPC